MKKISTSLSLLLILGLGALLTACGQTGPLYLPGTPPPIKVPPPPEAAIPLEEDVS